MLCLSEASVTLLVLQKKVKSRIDEVNTVEVIVLAIYENLIRYIPVAAITW